MMFKKKNLIHMIVSALICVGIGFSAILSFAFSSSNVVSAMTYSLRKERKNDGTNFSYAEATAKEETNIFNDPTSAYAVTFDNYWHFTNRPDIFAFKKWDVSLNNKTNEYVYPLSFDYEVGGEISNYSVPIISIIGNRWEGDVSHLGLKLTQDDFYFDLNDNIAIQNSVILSDSLATKLSPDDVNALIGKKVTSNVLFLNSYYNQAHYNNSAAMSVIDEINIVGVFTQKSSEKMSRYVNEDFVFMFGGKEGTYNHSGLKIGCHFSSDDYANNVALTQFLSLDNDKSSITFYNFKDNRLVVDRLQQRYTGALKLSNSPLRILGPMIFVPILAGLIYLFWKFVLKTKSQTDTYVCLITFLLIALLVTLVKMITFGTYPLVLANPIGCCLFFAVAIVLAALLLKTSNRKQEISNEQNENLNNSYIMPNIVAFFAQAISILSLYVALFSLIKGAKYFLLSSIVAYVGMAFCLFIKMPTIDAFKNKSSNSTLKYFLTSVIPIIACLAVDIIIILIASAVLNNFKFNILALFLTVLITVIEYIAITFIKKHFLKKKSDTPKKNDYWEIKI